MINKFKEIVENEAQSWQEIFELRQAVESNPGLLLNEVAISSREQALERGVSTVQSLFKRLFEIGIDFNQSDPGHAVGHMVHDYVNGLMLARRLKLDPKSLFIGFLGGVFHDIGCTIVHRYQEGQRAVRHAEVAALIIKEVSARANMNEAEQQLLMYVVAAHTHYLKPVEVNCLDNERRTVKPYLDMYKGQPFYPVWLPRWVDRLDCNGPCFPARHYLTLIEPHEDFDGQQFLIQEFDKQMVPQTKEEAGHPTMLSHMMMFSGSQTNESPYGKYDIGHMVKLRDTYKACLDRVIKAAQSPSTKKKLSEDVILNAWDSFLARNIEPTTQGKKVAEQLEQMFRALPDNIRPGWVAGFYQTMREYVPWSTILVEVLQKEDPGWLRLPGITDNVINIIAPCEEWTTLI